MRILPISVKALLLIGLTLVVYFPALQNGLIWDDDAWLMNNRTLYGFDGLRDAWCNLLALQQYYPVTGTVFWIEYQLWGFEPFGYHLINVLLHGLNAVLFVLVLRKLRLPGAWFAGAVFALHPVMVESVAWITEIKNTLSTVFYLGSILTYLRFDGLADDQKPREWKWLWLSLALFLCALLSKSVTCTLPVVLVILIWWKRGRLRATDLFPLAPYLFLATPIGLLTAWLEAHHVGAAGPEWTMSWMHRVMLAGRVICFYFYKLLWPANLAFIYPRWRFESLWPFLFGGIVLGTLLLLWRWRSRIGRGPFAAAVAFIAALGPILGFVDSYAFQFSYVADHWQYLASLCLISLTARIPLTPGKANPRSVLLAIPLFVLGFLTWRQCPIYRNVETLWRDTLVKNPECWLAHHNLGFFLLAHGDCTEAEAYLRSALRLRRDFQAENNLGLCLMMQNRLEESGQHFDRAIALNPGYAASRWNKALLCERQGKKEEGYAIAQAELAQPSIYLDGLNSFAWLLATAKNPDIRDAPRAEWLARRGCELTHYLNPYLLDTLAASCAAQGRYREARQLVSRALIIASRLENDELEREIGNRLKLYQSNQPYAERS